MIAKIRETENKKLLRSENFNYNFDKVTGYYEQWGKTLEDDPQRCEFGPIIADIEISDGCEGPASKICSFCYKASTPGSNNMTLEQYKTVLDKLGPQLTQVALGSDASGIINPDVWKIMEYTRSKGIIPNITVADITEDTAQKLSNVCGAVAVSFYPHAGKDICYNSIDRLTKAGMDQINIHFVLAKFSVQWIDEIIEDIKTDPRLAKLNAVVLLSLKQKGRGVKYQGCSQEEVNETIKKFEKAGIGYGMDSCGAVRFLEAVKDHPRAKEYSQMVESCESTKFSVYINNFGKCVPCSFMEEVSWNTISDIKEFDMLDNSLDFLKDIWNSKEFLDFGKCSTCAIANGQGCHIYNI